MLLTLFLSPSEYNAANDLFHHPDTANRCQTTPQRANGGRPMRSCSAPDCGNQFADSVDVCPKCGTPFQSSPSTPSSGPDKQPAVPRPSVWSAPVGYILGVVYYIFYTVVFIIGLGLDIGVLHGVALFACLGLGMFTAFKLMQASPPKYQKPDKRDGGGT